MAIILEGAGLGDALRHVRSAATPMSAFRDAVRRIGIHLAVEVQKHLPTESSTVQTPLATCTVDVVSGPVVLVPVLRAGLGLLDGFLDILPMASVGYIGLRRDEETLQPTEYYRNMPPDLAAATAIVLDPMLATGGSMAATVRRLTDAGCRRIICASLLAAPEGLQAVESAFPTATMIVAAVDSHLDPHGFIMPGLGDAGDRLFGT